MNDGKKPSQQCDFYRKQTHTSTSLQKWSIEQMAYKWHVLIVTWSCLTWWSTSRKREKRQPQLRMILMRILNWTRKQSTFFSAAYDRCCFGVFDVWKIHIFCWWIYDNDDGIIHNIYEAKMGLAFIRICLQQFTSSHSVHLFFFLLARYIIWNDYVKWHHITIEMHGIYLIKSNSDNATFWEIHHQQQQTNDGDGSGMRLSNKSSRKSLCPILCTMYTMSYDLIYGITMKLRNILCLGRSVCFFSVFEASMFIPFGLHFETNNSLIAVFGIWRGFYSLLFSYLNESEDRWLTFKWAYFRLRLESNSIELKRSRFECAEWIFQLYFTMENTKIIKSRKSRNFKIKKVDSKRYWGTLKLNLMPTRYTNIGLIAIKIAW